MKDRLFLFANYEGQRSREAVQTTQSVPSANLRKGIVSYLYCKNPNDPKCQDIGTQTLQLADIQSMDQGCLVSGTYPNGNGVSQTVLDLWDGNPGESGQRNNLRGPGYFGVDMSQAKTWKTTESQALQFGLRYSF